MINILFLHQSAELYGSDKTLLILLKNLDKSKFRAIVVLPSYGPLKDAIESEGIDVIITPVLKLYRNIFRPRNILNFIKDLNKAFNVLDNLNREYRFDFIYSNTLAVLLGILYARRRKMKHLWHVHEIIQQPKVFKKAFSILLGLNTNTSIVYNSRATQTFWESKKTKNKGVVIWNGIENVAMPPSTEDNRQLRKTLFKSNDDEIIIALVGRISRWKGQLLLLEAFKDIKRQYPNCKLIFVGSPPPGQDIFLINLQEKVKEYKLENNVTILPFTENISSIWHAIDIAVVPSIEPEPFGMVAIEAMQAGKPVIAANHGGLSEIIVDGKTGILFPPASTEELKKAIVILLQNETIRHTYGSNGRKRIQDLFSVNKYVGEFDSLFEQLASAKNS